MSTLHYTTQVTVKSGRAGHAKSVDGLLDIPLAFPKVLGGAGNATNPEQLLAAGFGACFGTSMLGTAKHLGIGLKDVTVSPEVELYQGDPSWFFKITLNVHTEGVSKEEAEKVIAAAEQVCAFSHALRGNVEVTIQLQDL
jgi:lipoyl-dependent peroxiredoxin